MDREGYVMLATTRQSKGTIYTSAAIRRKGTSQFLQPFNLFGYKLMAEKSNPKPKKVVVLGLSCNLVC